MGILTHNIRLHTEADTSRPATGRHTHDDTVRRAMVLMELDTSVSYAVLSKSSDGLPYCRVERDGTETPLTPGDGTVPTAEDDYQTLRRLAANVFAHSPDVLSVSRLGEFDGAWSYDRRTPREELVAVPAYEGGPETAADLRRLITRTLAYVRRPDIDRETVRRYSERYPLMVDVFLL